MLEPLQFICASAVHAGIVLVPVLVYAAVKRSKQLALASSITFALVIVQALVLSSPNFGPLTLLKMNWLQKLFVFLLTLVVARVLLYDKADWGFKQPHMRNVFLLAIALGIITAVPTLVEIVSKHEVAKFNLEYLLYELSMPGLHEEPLYRGLLLCLWDRATGRPWKFLGTEIGIGTIISSALFVLAHTFAFDHDFRPVIAPLWVWLDMSVFALAMVWLRCKCGSFWPPLVAHNLGNVTTNLVGVAIGRL